MITSMNISNLKDLDGQGVCIQNVAFETLVHTYGYAPDTEGEYFVLACQYLEEIEILDTDEAHIHEVFY